VTVLSPAALRAVVGTFLQQLEVPGDRWEHYQLQLSDILRASWLEGWNSWCLYGQRPDDPFQADGWDAAHAAQQLAISGPRPSAEEGIDACPWHAGPAPTSLSALSVPSSTPEAAETDDRRHPSFDHVGYCTRCGLLPLKDDAECPQAALEAAYVAQLRAAEARRSALMPAPARATRNSRAPSAAKVLVESMTTLGARPSESVEGVVDVEMQVAFNDGASIVGKVKLTPRSDGVFAAQGEPFRWVDYTLLTGLTARMSTLELESFLVALEQRARAAAAALSVEAAPFPGALQ